MLVPQEDLSGCAVACVAAYLGISYKQALQLFDQPKNASFVGFYCPEIVRILKKAGVEEVKWRYIKPKIKSKIYQPGTIVFVAQSPKYPTGHYLLRIDDCWMDPWINFPHIGVVRAGIRKQLPGRPIYAIFTKKA